MRTDQAPKEKPAGSANNPAGHTDGVIVLDTAQRIKTAFLHQYAPKYAHKYAHNARAQEASDPPLILTGRDVPGAGMADTTDRDEKRFATLQAKFAMLGHTLHPSGPGDGPGPGPVSYLAERGGMARHLPTLGDADQFLVQVGGAGHEL